MAAPSHPKSLHLFYVFSFKFPSSSTGLKSIKLKAHLHSFILSQLRRMNRALTKAKSTLVDLVKQIQLTHFGQPSNTQNNKNKLSFSSFRRNNSWCTSSHVLPLPSLTAWNSIIISPAGCNDIEASQLSGYLQWLEDKVQEDTKGEDMNEIDKLADMFIANCHEKFLLEKQESYRMFQEMMARSL